MTDTQPPTRYPTGPLPPTPAPTTSEVTLQMYRNRTRQLALRYLAEGGIRGPGPEGADAGSLVRWLEVRKPDLAGSTWGQYRAALMRTLRDDGFADAADRLQTMTRTGTRRKGTQTSATKRKRFPTQVRDRVIAWLIDIHSRHQGTGAAGT